MKSSSVEILAIGVEKYSYLPPLRGPARDLHLMKDLFSGSRSTAIYRPGQFHWCLDSTVEQAKSMITKHALQRSSDGDVLILYFSGHGVTLSPRDFGFCLTDTQVHPRTGAVLPMTVLKFNDIAETLSLAGVHPVFVVDACFSGQIGHSMTSREAIILMNSQATAHAASSYALLCACTDREEALTEHGGCGVFTQALVNIAKEGIGKGPKRHVSVLKVSDVFELLQKRVSLEVPEMSPRLFLGATMPSVPLFKNTRYDPQRLTFSKEYKEIIKFVYKRGPPYRVKTDDLKHVSQGAYCNNNKLSYEPWGLLRNLGSRRVKRLTKRGIAFRRGRLRIPKTLVREGEAYVPEKDTSEISINDL